MDSYVFVVEYGSIYSAEPYEMRVVCPTEKDAKAYIDKQVKEYGKSSSMFHFRPVKMWREESKSPLRTCQAYD
jgi:hypothetical protein